MDLANVLAHIAFAVCVYVLGLVTPTFCDWLIDKIDEITDRW